MPEIRFSITNKLDEILKSISDNYGVDKADYVRSLILNDLKNRSLKTKKK